MKTSELKKIVESEGLKFSKSHFVDAFYISNETEHLVYINSNEFEYLTILKGINRILAHAIVDYAYTPPKKREEEKKYKLRMPKQFESAFNQVYVNLFGGKYIISTDNQTLDSQTIFTQEEINTMPFDTNFFIKEEVQ